MKKGFTLIELLAVIVILAIISVIAVPIVVNIVNDAKNSGDEQSIELYIDTVKKSITKRQMNSPNFKPSKCSIKENGNLECEGTEIEIAMEGIKPNKGIIIIEESKIYFYNIEYNGKKYYPLANLLEENGDKVVSIGDKYSYKVNNIDTYNFYVLSIEDNNVNLIMDRNICGYQSSEDSRNGKPTDKNNTCSIAWYAESDDNSKGPITAMQGIYNATKNWNNVPDMFFTYNDIQDTRNTGYWGDAPYGYGEIGVTEKGIYITEKNIKVEDIKDNQRPTIPYENNKLLKARLPKFAEVYNTGIDVNHCHGDSGSCPIWLVENMHYYNVTYGGIVDKYLINNQSIVNQNIYGYWLLASLVSSSASAKNVLSRGEGNYSLPTTSSYDRGLRPVITVPRSYLE